MALRVPDAEAVAIGVLRARGITARDLLAPPWPATRVVRVGGSRGRVLDLALLQIDVANAAGGSKAATLAHLEAALGALQDAEGRTVDGAVVSAVIVEGAPLYQPASDGAPRYLATVAMSSHAVNPQGA